MMYTPLMVAATNGDRRTVEMLLANEGMDVNTVMGWNKTSALMLAAKANNLDIVEMLIARGASLDLQNSLGDSALMIAAEKGNFDIVVALANAGANIGLQNEYKHTAAILATENGHLEVVQWLVHFAIEKDDIADQLEVRNRYDKNVTLVAAEFGKLDILAWLVADMKVDVNMKTWKGITPLMYGCSGNKTEEKTREAIVDCLLNNGAKVDNTSKDGDTALFWAAIGGAKAVVKRLLKAKAEVNCINKRGFTALMKAAERGHRDIVAILIEYGAEKWPLNKDYRNAMKLAWMNGHVNTATDFFMIDETYDILRTPVNKMFTDEELRQLAKLFSNPANHKSLKALIVKAVKHYFHFDLFITLVSRLDTPSIILNKHLPSFYHYLHKRSMIHDTDVMYKLSQVAAALSRAALKHPLEKIDLMERYVPVPMYHV
jgi:ankyrin repeat protein